MNAIEKLAERIYIETDFGRSIATTLAGVIGLGVYLSYGDWVIAAFSSIISFPIMRLIASGLHEKAMRRKIRGTEREEAKYRYDQMSSDEKAVVQYFVEQGGCVVTWAQVNNSPLNMAAIESLIQRDLLSTSMTADGMRETFVLDAAMFDAGQSVR
tara:strand:+ start:130515 stop:130982 length:468 start_codon:yes stop_codon:yes gene_type:complete